jgi:hypothetical protein
MKTIYIASGVNHEENIFMQENAYLDRDLALKRAELMCQDVNPNTGMNIIPEVTEMTLYEDGDTIVDTINSN